MESILAVINTTELVVEIRPEKNSGPYGIWTHDHCDTGAATSSVVFITARIDSIFRFFNRSEHFWFSYVYNIYH